MYIHIYMCLCVCVCVCVCVCIYIYIYICMYVCMYVYIYIYIYITGWAHVCRFPGRAPAAVCARRPPPPRTPEPAPATLVAGCLARRANGTGSPQQCEAVRFQRASKQPRGARNVLFPLSLTSARWAEGPGSSTQSAQTWRVLASRRASLPVRTFSHCVCFTTSRAFVDFFIACSDAWQKPSKNCAATTHVTAQR